MKFDLSTPEGRAAAIKDAGPDAYNKMMEQFQKDSIVAIAYGHPIRLINSQRFGQLYSVGKTMAFQHLAGAKQWASENPKEPEPDTDQPAALREQGRELLYKGLAALQFGTGEQVIECCDRADEKFAEAKRIEQRSVAERFESGDLEVVESPKPELVGKTLDQLRPGPEPFVMRAMERKPI